MAAGHLRVHSRCGLCGLLFCAGDRFYTLVNDGGWPVQIFAYGIFRFPQSRYCDAERLCRVPDCRECLQETGTTHVDCITLLIRRVSMLATCDTEIDIQAKFCLVWVAATWRGLWPGGSSLNIQPEHEIHFSDVKTLGRLEQLPDEIHLMIRDMCIQTMCNNIWYCSVLDLARRLSKPPMNNLNNLYQGPRIPLMDIKAWIRGEAPQVGDVGSGPIIRFSCDARGLARIERLERVIVEESPWPDHMCYFVEAAERSNRVSVEFQFGMARLRGLSGSIHIWDTPCPPPLYRIVVDHDIITQSDKLRAWHLGTVDLSQCTGMTFLVSGGSTYAVHAHTETQPFASRTLMSLPLERRNAVTWVYLPIWGRIKEVGFTMLPNRLGFYVKSQHLLFQFDSGRDVLIGHYDKSVRGLVSLRRPKTLIYRKNDTLPIDFVGGFSKKKKNKFRPKFVPQCLIPSREILQHAHVSSAPLEDVCTIRVYYVSGTELCRGLIVKYRSGERLALGQCRLGVEDFREYERPARLCFTKESVGVKIECLEDHDDVHEQTEWTCCEMKGVLYCWFNCDEMILEHK